jgi:hypothetical protein
MSRARRLSEIAKANQPVFDSTGNQWWLADPSAKKEQQAIPQPDSPAAPEPEPEPIAVAASVVASQNGNPQIFSANAAAPTSFAPQAVRVQAKAEESSDPTSRDLPSRLSGFKERFLWLGRKHRGE